MELLHVFTLFSELGEYSKLTFAVLIAGTVLILVNVVSHAIKEWLTRSAATRIGRADLLQQSLKPVLLGAENLIKRTLDVFVYAERSSVGSEQSAAASSPTRDLERSTRVAFYRLALFLYTVRCF